MCLCLKKPACVLANAHRLVPEHFRMSAAQRKCIWLEQVNPIILEKREGLLLIVFPNGLVQGSWGMADFIRMLWGELLRSRSGGIFWSIFPSVELRCISHSDVAARGAEVKSTFLLFRIWKLLVQRNCTNWEVGEERGTRTGNANKQQHLSPSLAASSLGLAMCFAAMFIFLVLLF